MSAKSELAQWAERNTERLAECGIFVGVYDDQPGEERAEFILQIGYCVLHNKPIILPVPHGVVIPPKLMAVADCVVRYDPKDMTTLQDGITSAVNQMQGKG